MAILEKIRKRSLLLIVIIGLSLFSFVISDAIQTGRFGMPSSTIGKVNGERISRDAFNQEVEVTSRRYGGSLSNLQVADQVWNLRVRNSLLEEQYKKAGIRIEEAQTLEIIKSNPGFAQDTMFQNEAGVFDENRFIEFLADLKANNPAGFEQWKLQEEALVKNTKEQTYFNLIKAGIQTTLKEGEYSYRAENDKVAIEYIQIPYSSIPDSTITLSEEEMKKYARTHEKEFEPEPLRSIQYVYFEEKASPEDEEALVSELTALLRDQVTYNAVTKTNDTVSGFVTTSQLVEFVNAHSDVPFDSTFVAKEDLSEVLANSLFNLSEGALYGPYKDGDAYKISKMIAKKPEGIAKASHILISYKGALRANPTVTLTKDEARAKAQKVLADALKTPESFTDLARENSSDLQTASKGGDLGYFQEKDMVKPFSDFVFGNPVDKIGVVETDFGFHIIRVTAKEPTVQLATLVRRIEPSETTISAVFQKATEFEIAVSKKDFAEAAKEKRYAIRPVKNLKALDETITGIGEQREIVQWAFKTQTKVGDLKRFNVKGGYALAQLTEKTKKGMVSSEEVNVKIKPVLLKQKKAALILSKNKEKSLEKAATAANVPLRTASELTIKKLAIPGVGREPKVIGVALALEKGQTSKWIEGESGVYLVTVTDKEIAKPIDNYSTYANAQKTAARSRVNGAAYNALKEAARIKDNRAEFY